MDDRRAEAAWRRAVRAVILSDVDHVLLCRFTFPTQWFQGALRWSWRHPVAASRPANSPSTRYAESCCRGRGSFLTSTHRTSGTRKWKPLASPTATRVSSTITTRSAPHDSPLVVPCPTRTSLPSTSATFDGGALRTSPHMTAVTSSRRAKWSLHWRRPPPVELRPRRSSLACEAAPLIPIDHVAQACIGGILQDVVKRADLCAGSPQETVQSSLHLDSVV